MVLGEADDHCVPCLIDEVGGELCVCCSLLIVVGLDPWRSVLQLYGEYRL